jgi:hypothetical protein
MGKVAPSIEQIEDWFYEALDGAGRGLTYGKAWRGFSRVSRYKDRASKTYLRELREGIEQGRVKSVSCYRGPGGLLFGRTEDPTFVQAKGDAQRPVSVVKDPTMSLGGPFQQSPYRLRWEICPEKSRMLHTMVYTLGVVDFMRCDVCKRFHVLGIRPDYMDRRPKAWELDPLFFKEDYADSLSRTLFGRKGSRIPRIRKGGQYQGVLFRAYEWGNPEVWNEAMDRAKSLRWKSRKNPTTAKPKAVTRPRRGASNRSPGA